MAADVQELPQRRDHASAERGQDHVETIAFALAGQPFEVKHRLLVDAFKHALEQRPDLTDYELDPRVVQLVADIFQRISELERQSGRA